MHQHGKPAARRAEPEGRGTRRQGEVRGDAQSRRRQRNPSEARVRVGVVSPGGTGQRSRSRAHDDCRAGRDGAVARTAGQARAEFDLDHECRHDDRPSHDSRRIAFERERRMMTLLNVIVLAVAGLSAGQGKQTFTGVITDSECPTDNHSKMRMGPTDAECVTACIADHGASYLLYDGKRAYALSDQKTPERFAARTVTIPGAIYAKLNTIN